MDSTRNSALARGGITRGPPNPSAAESQRKLEHTVLVNRVQASVVAVTAQPRLDCFYLFARLELLDRSASTIGLESLAPIWISGCDESVPAQTVHNNYAQRFLNATLFRVLGLFITGRGLRRLSKGPKMVFNVF